MLPPPSPGPTPPALKTILQQTVRPFCSVFRNRLGMAVVIEQNNNRLLVTTFPLLDAYNTARVSRIDTGEYFSARKIDMVNRQLSDNLDRMLAMINGGGLDALGPPSGDFSRAAQIQASLGQIYAYQRVAQHALAQFVGAVLYAVEDRVEDDLDARNHAVPVTAVEMPGLAELIKTTIVQANISEQQMRSLVQQAAQECPENAGAG